MAIPSLETISNRNVFVCEILLFAIGRYACQVPELSDIPKYLNVLESLPKGSILFNFNATHQRDDEDIEIRTMGADTSDIVVINQTRGNDISVNVITKSELDRDGDGRGYPGQSVVALKFIARDLMFNEISFDVPLYISDVNDNTPVLQNQPYIWEIAEHPLFGNETYDKITATDLDSGMFGTGGIRYSMKTKLPDENDPGTFIMDDYTGDIALQRKLDYERQNYYQFIVTASDENGTGKTSAPVILTIKVKDVQDTPPFFTSGSYKAYVQKDYLNSFVIQVHALDGDTGHMTPNHVSYSILPGPCSDFFRINSEGEIHVAKPLDSNGEAFEPSCELTVMAQEVDRDQSQQFGLTKTNTTVYVIVESKDGTNQDRCSGGTKLFVSWIVSMLFALILHVF